MKVILTALNSQYVHTNLAVLYLKAACDQAGLDTEVLQFSINEPLQQIFGRIITQKPEVVAFSCYIWNIEQVRKLSADIKKVNPGTVVIAGGPEAGFDEEGTAAEQVCFDYVIGGEGEEKLPFLLKLLKQGKNPSKEEEVWLSRYSVIENLKGLASPYDLIKKGELKNRIAYLEASRGCPFRCAYCFSSLSKGVRFFDTKWVYGAMEKLADSGAGVIKFVDRTFNADERRAVDILNHIRRFASKNLVFHIEIAPALLTEAMVSQLAGMPMGLVQIEAGIQSIHPETLKAVNRPLEVDKAFVNLKKILSSGNVHVHVDLIAGLPLETPDMFKASFNRVYGLFAHHFQVGFLKLLKGTPLKEAADRYGYRYRDYPPYEVIGGRCLPAEAVLRLKDVEACVDLFYNSGRLSHTLRWIHGILAASGQGENGPVDFFGFYEQLAVWMRRMGYLDRPVKASALYSLLYYFLQEIFAVLPEGLMECMRFDYFRSMKNPSVPDLMRSAEKSAKERCTRRKITDYREELLRILPRLQKIALEKIYHQIYITTFCLPEESGKGSNQEMAFDFGQICPVTGHAGVYPLHL